MTARAAREYAAEDCPDAAAHTTSPRGYLAWHEWAEKKQRTHVQVRCQTCGKWAIWVKK